MESGQLYGAAEIGMFFADLSALPHFYLSPITMTTPRHYVSSEFMQSSQGEPIRSVVTTSPHATVVAWHIEPGQRIAAHIHPHGQDTWTVLSGVGEYLLDTDGQVQTIAKGDVLVAHQGQVHGVLNHGHEPLRFISVVAPFDAGFELL